MDAITTTDWEAAIAGLLTELSGAQDELLELLTLKRNLLVTADAEGLAALAPREEQLIARLEAVQHTRTHLLAQAKAEGKRGDSIRSVAKSLDRRNRAALEPPLEQAAARARILQHQSLTNWVIVQRSLIHLAQMLEIIATGGRLQPTYGMGPAPTASGSLVDQAA